MKHLKPLIGIVPDYKEGSNNGYSIKDYYALRANYVETVNKYSGAAIILTYDYDLIDFYLSFLDGLMIVGGHFDINPKRYGEKEIHKSVKLNEVRENFEYELGLKAIKTKLPFFGICNGMQLINILHNGDIIQHIPDDKSFIDHEQNHVDGFSDYKTAYHDVLIERNSKFFSIVKSEKIKTNSSHHQSVRNGGDGLKIVGRASDGVVEAIEKVNHPFCVGVQWHPEFDASDADQKLFKSFIEAAGEYKESKN